MEDFKVKKTILKFIFVHDENARLDKYFKEINLHKADVSFYFNCQKVKSQSLDNDLDSFDDIDTKIYVDVSKSNDINIDVELDENRIYYNEEIDLVPIDNSNIKTIAFEYSIYKDKINIIYIDVLNGQGNISISLEIIYQTIKTELLPKSIIYKGKELTSFDSFDNKLRQRIGFANVDPEKFNFIEDIHKRYPDFKFINKISYQILVRIPINKKNEYSIAKNEFKYLGLKKQPHKFKNKKSLLDSLNKFKNEYEEIFVKTQFDEINDVENKINEFAIKYNFLEAEKIYYDNMLDYSDFEDIDQEIFILMFYFLEFLVIKDANINSEKKIQIIDILDNLYDFNLEFEKYISQIKKLNLDRKDKLLLIKAYNKKFIDSYKSGYQIDYITIINVEKENELNPYKKAINFIKKIIINLKEESRLFEAFLYLDSDVIKNLLINIQRDNEEITDIYGDTKIIKYSENPTEYGINMINLDEVKSHLLKLIPKYIIRIDTGINFNADFDPNSKIMTLNERKLFNKSSKGLNKTFQKEKVSDKYVLPISIEVLHEIFGHGKKRLNNIKDAKSPEDYRDSKYNFKRISIKKRISNFKEIIYPESGVFLENYISENRNVLKWLKSLHPFEEYKRLLDVSLWVDEKFNNLEKIVEQFINKDKRYKENNSQFSSVIHEEDLVDYDDDMCGFHKFDNNY